MNESLSKIHDQDEVSYFKQYNASDDDESVIQ